MSLPIKNKYKRAQRGQGQGRKAPEKERRAVKCLMGFGLQNVLEITNDQIMRLHFEYM